jgi:imidazolonepropionase-like amidohydrolase
MIKAFNIAKSPPLLVVSIVCVLSIALFPSCGTSPKDWANFKEEGAFIVHRRQAPIGEETYTISTENGAIVVKSLQGENERGRITGVQTELRLNMDLTPTYYVSRRLANNDTTNIFKMEVSGDKITHWEKATSEVTSETPSSYFPVHSNIPAAMEMMLYHYYFQSGKPKAIQTFPRGEVAIVHTGEDIVQIKGASETLQRYVVEGINWGGRTIWVNQDNQLVALVKANTQIREMVRKGYEEALPTFIAGNVTEQINALRKYTADHKQDQPEITALVGGDVIDGLTDRTLKDMTLIIEQGKIKVIGKKADVTIPSDAKIIDVTGKTLMPGLFDMHAHSNQVQWAPAYLAGGVTTIRDNGNEIEFATAFRDEIALNGALGPDILLAGMTDGAGIRGNGVIRATSEEQAKEVVEMYFNLGYKQIKIYQSVEPEVVKVLADEAHKRGIKAAGHVPTPVGSTRLAIESGMDLLSHGSQFLGKLFPDESSSEAKAFLNVLDASPQQIKEAQAFLLKHKTVLDPTMALMFIRNQPRGTLIETVEPDAHRIAYELWEGKRFRSGISPARSESALKANMKEMEILGDFFKAGIPLVAGTDNAVPVFNLYLEIENYHRLAGLTTFEALTTATIIPARVMGIDSETGTLEVGKEADIAILDKNPLENISHIRTVSAVVTNGNYYESNPLWKAADFKLRKD